MAREQEVDHLISLRVAVKAHKGRRNYHLLYAGTSLVLRSFNLSDILEYLRGALPCLIQPKEVVQGCSRRSFLKKWGVTAALLPLIPSLCLTRPVAAEDKWKPINCFVACSLASDGLVDFVKHYSLEAVTEAHLRCECSRSRGSRKMYLIPFVIETSLGAPTKRYQIREFLIRLYENSNREPERSCIKAVFTGESWNQWKTAIPGDLTPPEEDVVELGEKLHLIAIGEATKEDLDKR